VNGPVLVDTGPLVAILSRSDEYHEMCILQMEQTRGPFLTCWPVLTEAAWLLRSSAYALDKLLAAFDSDHFGLLQLDKTDLPGIRKLLSKYRSLGIQLADAALVHLANRERIETIFTLDRRDFGVLRLRQGKKLRIIP
jgi:predicted nucleic acid-binding protein